MGINMSFIDTITKLAISVVPLVPTTTYRFYWDSMDPPSDSFWENLIPYGAPPPDDWAPDHLPEGGVNAVTEDGFPIWFYQGTLRLLPPNLTFPVLLHAADAYDVDDYTPKNPKTPPKAPPSGQQQPQCPPGTTYDAAAGGCVCPPGTSWDGSACVRDEAVQPAAQTPPVSEASVVPKGMSPWVWGAIGLAALGGGYAYLKMRPKGRSAR